MIPKKLEFLINNEKRTEYKEYTLDSIKSLLKRFGNPQDKIKTIHIAGTNGKGSVAHSMTNILKKSGYKVGLYTSPHLIKVNERIKINDIEITDEVLNSYIDEVFDIIDKEDSLHPTYFDVLTFIGFKYFSDQKVDMAVIETGLGGRLDTTNVITPLCSILTDISIDHKLILGDTIEKIAGEKCGIIKQGIPVVTSNEEKLVLSIIREHCSSRNSELFEFDNSFHISNVSVTERGFNFDYKFDNTCSAIDSIDLPLPGKFQCKNMSLSITASLLLKKHFPDITLKSIREGVEQLSIPGRFEILHSKPLAIFDPAHNPAAMEKVIEILKSRYSGTKEIVIILSLMKDKNYLEILDMLRANEFEIYYYPLKEDRGYSPGKDDKKGFEVVSDINEISEIIRNKDIDDLLIFFTGSFRLYSEAQNFVKLI